MCGIAGVIGTGDVRAVAACMSGAICHRGPDDEGAVMLHDRRGAVRGAFAHRRLAIIDLSPGGHQPMAFADDRYSLVFNGEIYNYRDLRAGLEGEGQRFRSGSDTEVILAGWARHGRAFAARLRGMFAFVLWDRDEGKAFLVRDPYGIKPLYVASRDGSLGFSSEVRALLASGLATRALSPQSVASYLSAGSIQEPLTLIRGVTSVPAGCIVEVSTSDGIASARAPVSFARALEPADRAAETQDRAEAARLVREALRDSVAHHLVSDVPVAAFLSGGIDSSAVVALAAELTDRPLSTFTVVFEEADHSEIGPARAVATRFGTDHTEIMLTGRDMLAALPDAFAAMDQPSMDGLNTYVVSRGVRERGIKVVLSGLGGDEMFAGYSSFRRARRIAPLWRALSPARKLGAALAGRGGGIRAAKLGLLLSARTPALAAYRASRALFAGAQLRELSGIDMWPFETPAPEGLSLLQQVSFYELTGYMRSTLLRDSDVFSMAHALELRVPFVDREVAAASLRVTDDLKLRGKGAKPVLVDAMRDLLPREVWDRPKQGFALPFAAWMNGPLRHEVASAFTAQRLARVGVNADAARDVWAGFLARRAGYTWSRPWAIYTLVRWAEQLDLSTEEAPPAALSPVELALR